MKDDSVGLCYGKEGYTTFGYAKKQLKRMGNRHKIKVDKLTEKLCIYRCTSCHKYHIGRSRRTRAKGYRRKSRRNGYTYE